LYAKSGASDESSTKSPDTLNVESVDGESSDGSGNLGIISASVSVVVLLILVGAAYVSRLI
jgi:hypothetical protein